MTGRNLTSEKLRNRFDNPFALVNYAIGISKRKIARGEGTDSNVANEVIEMIIDGDDLLEYVEEPKENGV